jgi:hypothetical protein
LTAQPGVIHPFTRHSASIHLHAPFYLYSSPTTIITIIPANYMCVSV